MDRRRFEEAHLKYAVHKMKASYSSAFGQVSTIRGIDIGSTLEKMTPTLISGFKKKYGGKFSMVLCLF